MALRFCDSFDHYATADGTDKYNTFQGAISTGRFGSALHHTSGGSQLTTQKIIDAQATWIVGFAMRRTGNNGNPFFVALDGATTHLDLRMINDVIQVTRNGTQIGLGATTMNTNVWYYVEFKFTISDTGSFTVRINGVADPNLDNVSADTRNAGNASVDRFNIRGGTNLLQWHCDDLYICDASGSTNNDFLGDVRVEALQPDGNGNSSQFVGSDANSTDNYLLVDEATPNADTDYVESGTVGNKDTYTFEAMASASGSVYGVQIVPYAKKTDAGSRSIATVARLSGTEVDGPDRSLSTDYLYWPDVRETKPGGGAWSISDVNSAEFGIKVTV